MLRNRWERWLAHAWRLAGTLPDRPLPAGWRLELAPGDRLAPGARAVIAAALAAAPEARMAYADTVRIRGGRVAAVDLKPAFDPVFDAARPLADFALCRAGPPPAEARHILHIPWPALITAREAETRPFTPPARLPSIAVVIPSRDAPRLIRTVLAGLDATDYPDLSVVVADNGSTDPETLAEYARRPALRVLMAPGPFDFAAQVNRAVAATRSEAVLLLNNDVEVIAPGWLREMAACLGLPGVGIVGARLVYPDGRLQHAGTILGLGGGLAGHWFAGAPPDSAGPADRLRHRGAFSAVTAACMLVSRRCWEVVGGMDAERFRVAYNDVDFCLRAAARGFATLWTPFATLIHHEKATRRLRGAADRAAFAAEQAALRARHGTHRVEDPAFSPWLTRSIRPRPRRLAAIPPGRHFRGPHG
ncbi:MAG: glycosyltransferase family 2 protein [Alphaproteobacteria bacterium]|nr:MAG: glycosyltransferase family 2 protein [Alphaproteobacteria bacterium]